MKLVASSPVELRVFQVFDPYIVLRCVKDFIRAGIRDGSAGGLRKNRSHGNGGERKKRRREQEKNAHEMNGVEVRPKRYPLRAAFQKRQLWHRLQSQ